MSRTSTIVSSTSILGVGLSVVLDLIEPYLGGFQVATICSLIVLALGLVVWALPPLNNYLLSAARSPEFRDLIRRFWPKPFFISNMLLLVILLTMLQLSNKYNESGGFTRTALSSLNVIEVEVKEIREISAEHLEVSKKVAETTAFNQSNNVYYSMLQYIRNGYSISELESNFPKYSAEVASNVITLLLQAFPVYKAEDQISLLKYLTDHNYIKPGQSLSLKLKARSLFDDLELPTTFAARTEELAEQLKAIASLQRMFDRAPDRIKDYRQTIDEYRNEYGNDPDIIGSTLKRDLKKIRELEKFLAKEDEVSDIFEAAQKLPRLTRSGHIHWNDNSPKMFIELDPLALTRLKGSPSAAKWLAKNTDFTGDRITTVDMAGARAVYEAPEWNLKNSDEFFWQRITGEEQPDVEMWNSFESSILALDVAKIADLNPGYM